MRFWSIFSKTEHRRVLPGGYPDQPQCPAYGGETAPKQRPAPPLRPPAPSSPLNPPRPLPAPSPFSPRHLLSGSAPSLMSSPVPYEYTLPRAALCSSALLPSPLLPRGRWGPPPDPTRLAPVPGTVDNTQDLSLTAEGRGRSWGRPGGTRCQRRTVCTERKDSGSRPGHASHQLTERIGRPATRPAPSSDPGRWDRRL